MSAVSLGRSKVKAALTEVLALLGVGVARGVRGTTLPWFYRWEHGGPDSVNNGIKPARADQDLKPSLSAPGLLLSHSLREHTQQQSSAQKCHAQNGQQTYQASAPYAAS